MSKRELLEEIKECTWDAQDALEQERYSDVVLELKRIREVLRALGD